MSILDIASKMEAELSEKEQAIRVREVAVAEKEAQLNADKKSFEAKKKEYAEIEKDIKAQARSVEQDVTAIRTNEEMNKALIEVANGKQEAMNSMKKASEILGDANLKLKEVEKRELAVAKKESEFKEVLQKAVIENIANNLLKGVK